MLEQDRRPRPHMENNYLLRGLDILVDMHMLTRMFPDFMRCEEGSCMCSIDNVGV